MFSVGASPYNSRARQLYGGWTLADVGNNMWGKKQYYEMSAKYNPDPDERANARTWLRMYKERAKGDKAYQKTIRAAGKPYWSKAIYPPLTSKQKEDIWNAFTAVPFSTSLGDQVTSRLIRKSPYPNWKYMYANPSQGVPYAETSDTRDWATYNPIMLGTFRDIDNLGFNRRLREARARRAQFAADFAPPGAAANPIVIDDDMPA